VKIKPLDSPSFQCKDFDIHHISVYKLFHSDHIIS